MVKDKYTLELTKEELTTLNALITGRIVSLLHPKGYMTPEVVEDVKRKLIVLKDKVAAARKG